MQLLRLDVGDCLFLCSVWLSIGLCGDPFLFLLDAPRAESSADDPARHRLRDCAKICSGRPSSAHRHTTRGGSTTRGQSGDRTVGHFHRPPADVFKVTDRHLAGHTGNQLVVELSRHLKKNAAVRSFPHRGFRRDGYQAAFVPAVPPSVPLAAIFAVARSMVNEAAL